MIKYLLLPLFGIFTIWNLNAQDKKVGDSTKNIQEVEFVYQANNRTPVTFQDLSEQEIDSKSNGQEPSFIFSETPSITNYSDAGNSQGYSYLRIRGIDQTRINITLDGVPINDPEDQGAYFSNYPDLLNSVRKIQIQRGVGTSKNGMASYGGSIEMFAPNLKDTSKITVGAGYGSFNSYRLFGEYKSGLKKKKALYIRASQIASDGYKYSSANNSQSVFISGGLFGEKLDWKLTLLAGQQRNKMAWLGVADSLIEMDRRTNANSSQEDDQFIQTLTQIKNTFKINDNSVLQSSLYYTYLKGDYDFDFNNFLGFPSTTELYNYAFQSNLIGFYSNYTLLKKRLEWKTGIHGNLNNRKHVGSEKTFGELYSNTGFKNEASIFSKATYTYKWLTAYTDLQYRLVEFDYTGAVQMQKQDWQFFNPKIGFSAQLKKSSVVYYSFGITGREPTRNDMFGGNDDLLADSLGQAILFNTQAESVMDHELGIRLNRDKLKINLNLFYMDFENEIVLDGNFGPNGLALTNNVERSYRTGIELSLQYDVNAYFSLVNNSSFNYSRIQEQDEVFTPILTPPIISNQEVIFHHNNLGLSLSARYQHMAYMDFANSAQVDSYVLLNARASYRLQNFQFSLFVNNLTNARYFNHGYVDYDGSKKYFVQAPIHFKASVQYSF